MKTFKPKRVAHEVIFPDAVILRQAIEGMQAEQKRLKYPHRKKKLGLIIRDMNRVLNAMKELWHDTKTENTLI